ncbi:MAG: ferredoxin [Pseudomonadota bacterium]
MADKSARVPDNVGGKYYVDEHCIVCDACVTVAPNNFKLDEDKGYAYVIKQPEDSGEQSRCKEAMDGCPVEAIGDDGS